MPYFEHNGLQFYYVEAGSGMPFIFLHGLGGSVEQVLKIYSPPAGIKLISLDQRAHGKTSIGEARNLNFKALATDVLALMNHLQIESTIIGGISMGAGVALNFTLSYPEKVSALILSRPAWLNAPMQESSRSIYNYIAKLIKEHGTAARQIFSTSDVYNDLYKISPEYAQSFLLHFNYEHAVATAIKYKLLPEDAPTLNREEWKRLKVPVLVLANRSDQIHPYEYGLEYASHIDNATFKEITPKTISEVQHREDVQKNIDAFIANVLNKPDDLIKQFHLNKLVL